MSPAAKTNRLRDSSLTTLRGTGALSAVSLVNVSAVGCRGCVQCGAAR